MNRHILKLLATLVVCVLLLANMPTSSEAATVVGYKFGSNPYWYLDYAAGQALSGKSFSDLNLDELKLIMMAPTYNEVVAKYTAVEAITYPTTYTYEAPSPMAVGRADVNLNLYAGGSSNNPEQRDFWHAGIGMWQLDSSGMGSHMSMDQRIDSFASAKKVADQIVSEWANLSSSLTPEQKRTEVWWPWVACGTKASNRYNCRRVFNDLYDVSTRSIKLSKLTMDGSVGTYGGATWQTCNWKGSPSTFACLRVNPDLAEGSTGAWYYSVNGAAYPNTPTPLTHTSIVFLGSNEYRYWLAGETYTITRWGQGQLGYNERGNVYWSTGQNLCVNGNCGNGN